jgi:DNA-binding LytR/AlgR family response regulator
MKIRALVVDDEPRARARMRRLLALHEDVVVVGEAPTGDEAMQQALSLRPDVVFLDIHMPGSDGMAVAARLRDYLPESVRPLLVFTTAHAEHAVEAFGLESLDYLLKPVERDRLADCLRRVRRSVWGGGRAPGAAPAPSAPPATLTSHRGASLAAIAVGAIVTVEVEDGVAFAYTVDGERHRLGEGLAEVEATLPAPPFVRVSRRALVNLERVEALVPRDSGTWSAQLEDGRSVGISRRRAKRVRELLAL